MVSRRLLSGFDEGPSEAKKPEILRADADLVAVVERLALLDAHPVQEDAVAAAQIFQQRAVRVDAEDGVAA